MQQVAVKITLKNRWLPLHVMLWYWQAYSRPGKFLVERKSYLDSMLA